MAGSSAITLHRSEDATILLQFQARQAARVYVADLTVGTLKVEITAYPTDTSLLTLTSGQTTAGCSLTLTDAHLGRAVLFLDDGIWNGVPNGRCSVQAWFLSGATTQRLGEQLIDLTD